MQITFSWARDFVKNLSSRKKYFSISHCYLDIILHNIVILHKLK